MGETAIDQDTFHDYLEEMKEHYTADKVSRPEINCPTNILIDCYSIIFWVTFISLSLSNLSLYDENILELDFNCNSFTNDCIGFLTGGTIPSFIKGMQ